MSTWLTAWPWFNNSKIYCSDSDIDSQILISADLPLTCCINHCYYCNFILYLITVSIYLLYEISLTYRKYQLQTRDVHLLLWVSSTCAFPPASPLSPLETRWLFCPCPDDWNDLVPFHLQPKSLSLFTTYGVLDFNMRCIPPWRDIYICHYVLCRRICPPVQQWQVNRLRCTVGLNRDSHPLLISVI